MGKDNKFCKSFFSPELMKKVRNSFYGLEKKEKRIYFDNAGGAFRLKKAAEAFNRVDNLPDCSERIHTTANYLNEIIDKGKEDIRIIFNAHKGGQIISRLTASQVTWEITGVIAENVEGTNIVTSVLEHPSAFDAARFFADKTGKELRVAKSNPVTGGIDDDEVVKLIDKNTCLLSVMMASNISGTIQNISEIVKRSREIKPDLYIIVDAVQHAPHGLIDVDALDIDGIMFAPYKFFGVRGIGFGYASDRLSKLPHEHLIGEGEQSVTWKLGSPAPAHYAAISEVVNYVCQIGENYTNATSREELFHNGMKAIHNQEMALLSYMLEGSDTVRGLRKIKGVKVYFDKADPEMRDFIVAIGIDGWEYSEAVKEYEKNNIVVYERVCSNIYSLRMLNSFGIDGCIRISPLHCNSIDEIDEFLRVTEKIASSKLQR